MKKRSCALFLSMFLLCACSAPAQAAVTDTGFSDVSAGAWYADAAVYCREHGLMNGTSADIFSPGLHVSRAMLAAILYRLAGSPAVTEAPGFTDTPAGAWYADALSWASANGVMGGYQDGRFGPGDPVTRQQLAAVLWRYEGSPAAGGTEPFADQADIGAYAVPAAAWAGSGGIIGGKAGNRFAPRESATRAETAVILQRWLRGKTTAPAQPEKDEVDTMPKLTIQAGGRTFSATLEDHAAARALLERLPLTLSMSELNGNEKYCFTGEAFPTASYRPGNIQAGDLMLYGSDCIVLFYKSHSSSYSYTRLGRLEDPAGLAAALGGGSVHVTFQVQQ